MSNRSYRDEELREINKHCWCHDRCECQVRHNKGRSQTNIKDFKYYTLDPNVSVDNRLALPINVQTPVASVELGRIRRGDLVSLNGVFGLDNDAAGVATVIMRVHKGAPSVFIPGQEIYRAVIEIDVEGSDDQVIEPLAHVDTVGENAKNVTYTVTIEPDENFVFLNGPVTFTATLVDPS